MHLEEFAAGVSMAHRLDPRIKLVTTIAFSFVVALSGSWPVLLAGLVLAIILVGMAKLPLKKVIRRLAVVNTFILLLWVFLPFSHPGRELFHVGPLSISYEGVWYALAITIKSNAIVLSVMALLATSTVFTLVHALRHLYLPDKLVNMFFFHLPVLSGDPSGIPATPCGHENPMFPARHQPAYLPERGVFNGDAAGTKL
jgi:cobalt/nickel transport system permease protein